MQLIGARLGDHVDLATRLGAIFRIVQSAADAIFLDCVLRNLQARLRFLGLFLNAACVHAVNLKIIVVARSSCEANGSLIAATVILGERREQRETGPVAPVVREIRDLTRINDGGRFGGTAVRPGLPPT